MAKFRLSSAFLEKYQDLEPDWGPIGYFTYKRTYARPVQGEDRTEEWWETVKRVVEGTYTIQRHHCEQLKLPWNGNKAQRSAQEMYDLIFRFKFLPPGRGLWMMGTDYVIERGGAALNNCGYVSTRNISQEFADPFCFLMDMSMLGVGVGGDTKGAGTIKIREPRVGHSTFVVEDSREGWVEITRTILDAYAGRGSIPAHIDYSKVRPYGEAIYGFGGTASGPEPLQELVETNIPRILNPLIDQEITSTAIVDLFNAIGRCVVSGNVRRTAEIMLGDPNDLEYARLKDPELWPFEISRDGWRWASNNSILAEIGMDYTSHAERTAANGEPGYVWLDNARKYGRMKDPKGDGRPFGVPLPDPLAEGCNPCGEQTLESYELCCLVETFPARHQSYEEYQRTLKFAYLYAKTVTLLPTHNDRTNAVMLRNRRIGTSQSGIAQSFARHGIREHFRWCDEGYRYLRDLDDIYRRWLCIPASIKVTSVKPSGTVSLLCGSTPGVHFPRSRFYWRTVRHDATSPLTRAFRKAGYRVEEGEGHNTAIIYFPVEEKDFYRALPDMTIWEQLEIAAQMQYWWADNQVSVTISFKPEEAKDIPLALQLYETRLKSVSFLPYLSAEEMRKRGYPHPPIQPMTEEEYKKATKTLKPIKAVITSETKGFEKGFCDSDVCEFKPQGLNGGNGGGSD